MSFRRPLQKGGFVKGRFWRMYLYPGASALLPFLRVRLPLEQKSLHTTFISRAAKRGGFKRGGFPIWNCPSFLSFFVLFCPDSPERVRDAIWTFPEKSGKPPTLETPRFSFSQLLLGNDQKNSRRLELSISKNTPHGRWGQGPGSVDRRFPAGLPFPVPEILEFVALRGSPGKTFPASFPRFSRHFPREPSSRSQKQPQPSRVF